MLPEIAVFSGDTVRMDDEGFLYFIGRRDEMISPRATASARPEVEEVLYATQLVGECVAFGRAPRQWGEEARVGQHARVMGFELLRLEAFVQRTYASCIRLAEHA